MTSNKKEDIVIIGAGGFGREVYSILQETHYNVLGYIDSCKREESHLAPILGPDEYLEKLKEQGLRNLVIAIGNSNLREEIFHKVKSQGFHLPTIIHPTACIAEDTVIKEGSVIYPMAVIMSGCCIGECSLVNSGSTLGHDVKVGHFSNINPGAHIAGHVTLGAHCYVGLAANIIENLNIAQGSTVAAGATVISNVPAKVLVAGVPATIKKELS